MNRARILTGVVVALGIALGGACTKDGGDGGGPTGGPGTLRIVLAAANNQAEAIHFDINGSGISNVRASGGYTIHQRSESNKFIVALFGSPRDGTLVSFDVLNTEGTYTTNVVAVADGGNDLLDKNLYNLSVQK